MEKNERGNTLIIVLVTITVLLLAVVLLMPALSQRESNQERTYRNLQVTEMANSTMQSLLEDPSILLKEKNPLIIKTPDSDEAMDVYAEAKDAEGKLLKPEDLSTTSYTLTASAYYSDSNHNRKKDDGEKFFTKKIISTKVKEIEKNVLPLRIEFSHYEFFNRRLTLKITHPEEDNVEIYNADIINGKYHCTNVKPWYMKENSQNDYFEISTKNFHANDAFCIKTVNSTSHSDDEMAFFQLNYFACFFKGTILEQKNNQHIYHNIRPQFYTSGSLKILNDADTDFGGLSIKFHGDKGVEIEENAEINLSSIFKKSIEISTSEGDIIFQKNVGLSYKNYFSNYFYYIIEFIKSVFEINYDEDEYTTNSGINLSAKNGAINLDDSVLESDTNIHLTAVNISAKNAAITSFGEINFLLNANGKFNAENLKLNKNAVLEPKNTLICGPLLSGTINNNTVFKACSSN